MTTHKPTLADLLPTTTLPLEHAYLCPDCGFWGDDRNECDVCADDE